MQGAQAYPTIDVHAAASLQELANEGRNCRNFVNNIHITIFFKCSLFQLRGSPTISFHAIEPLSSSDEVAGQETDR